MSVLSTLALAAGPGAMVGLLALGLIAIFRSTGVLNLSHAAMATVGAYLYADLATRGWNSVVAFIAATVAVGILSMLVYLLVMRPLRQASPITKLVASVGVLLILQAALLLVYGNQFRSAPSMLPTGPVSLGGIAVGADRIALVAIAVGTTTALWALYRYTRFGLATRACAENPYIASVFGLRTERIALSNWLLGGLLAGAAGALLAPISGLSLSALSTLIVPALAAALIGSLTSFPLALTGGIVIAVLQAGVTQLTAMRGASDLVPLLLILVAVVARGKAIPIRSELGLQLPALGTGRVRPLVLGVVLAALIASVYLWLPTSLLRPLVVTLVIAIILLSVVVVTGYAGQVSLAQYAFAGFGGFIAVWLSSTFGLPFPVVFVAGVLGAALLGMLVALPALRVRSISLAVVTLAVSVLMFSLVFSSAEQFQMETPTLFGLPLSMITDPQTYTVVVIVALAVCGLMVTNLRRSPAGLRMIAVRGNERAAASLGINVATSKIAAFGISAGIAAVGGILLVMRTPVVTFEGFEPFQSAYVLAWATIGGTGFVIGPVVGAFLAPGSLGTTIGHSLLDEAAVLGLIGGALLVLTLILHPDGVASLPRDLRAHLHKKNGAAERSEIVELSRQLADTTVAEVRAPRSLVVSDVSVSFSGVKALSNVGFEALPGQVHGLIGSNGAGKTTLLDVIGGFARPTSGTVRLGDDDITNLAPHQRARLGLGRSFQNVQLFPDLSVLDNLRVAGAAQHRPTAVRGLVAPGKPVVSASALSAIEVLQLGPVLSTKVNDLTHGQRQLVSIARALAADPLFVTLDEPAAGLDEVEREELGRLLRKLAEERDLGILLIEHDVSLVMSVCDVVTVLHHGEVLASGPPEAVQRHPAVVAAYLGEGDDLSQLQSVEVE